MIFKDYQKVGIKILAKRILLGILFLFIALNLVGLYISIQMRRDFESKFVTSSTIDQSEFKTIVILGAGVKKNGSPTVPLDDRLRKGAQLFMSGEYEEIIVSGDNSKEHNNETDVMKKNLIEQYKLPEEKITVDPKGIRTYETCRRLNEVYHVEKAVLVTQDFHLYRTLYLCDQFGVDVRGVDADLRSYESEFYYEFREFYARIRAVWDIEIGR